MRPTTCSCSRRSFLHGCGLTLAGFGLTSLLPSPLLEHVFARAPSADRRLIFIFLRGGNDGINALIPHGDPDYNDVNRPTLYIPPADAIDLGNGFASLHPSLEDLMDPFDAGDLAVVHRIGYAQSSRSHFDGQRIWENGDPTRPRLFEGWLYRYMRENALSAGVDLPAIAVQSTPSMLLRGDESRVGVASLDPLDDLDPERSKHGNAWRRPCENLPGLEPYRPIVSNTRANGTDKLDEYRTWDQQHWNPTDPDTGRHLFPVSDETNPDDPEGPNGKKFPTGAYAFFRSLKLCTLGLLESDPGNSHGARIAGTEVEGWDTHENQGRTNGIHATLLSCVGYGFRSLRIALSGAATNEPRGYPSVWNETSVVTLSEFGRTTVENGSAGTDHAAASCLLLEGGRVKGGVYNCDPGTWPPGVMFARDGRYLAHRTDYRAIFWELLRDHMDADVGTLETIFPGYTAAGLPAQELGLIRT